MLYEEAKKWVNITIKNLSKILAERKYHKKSREAFSLSKYNTKYNFPIFQKFYHFWYVFSCNRTHHKKKYKYKKHNSNYKGTYTKTSPYYITYKNRLQNQTIFSFSQIIMNYKHTHTHTYIHICCVKSRYYESGRTGKMG